MEKDEVVRQLNFSESLTIDDQDMDPIEPSPSTSTEVPAASFIKKFSDEDPPSPAASSTPKNPHRFVCTRCRRFDIHAHVEECMRNFVWFWPSDDSSSDSGEDSGPYRRSEEPPKINYWKKGINYTYQPFALFVHRNQKKTLNRFKILEIRNFLKAFKMEHVPRNKHHCINIVHGLFEIDAFHWKGFNDFLEHAYRNYMEKIAIEKALLEAQRELKQLEEQRIKLTQMLCEKK